MSKIEVLKSKLEEIKQKRLEFVKECIDPKTEREFLTRDYLNFIERKENESRNSELIKKRNQLRQKRDKLYEEQKELADNHKRGYMKKLRYIEDKMDILDNEIKELERKMFNFYTNIYSDGSNFFINYENKQCIESLEYDTWVKVKECFELIKKYKEQYYREEIYKLTKCEKVLQKNPCEHICEKCGQPLDILDGICYNCKEKVRE